MVAHLNYTDTADSTFTPFIQDNFRWLLPPAKWPILCRVGR